MHTETHKGHRPQSHRDIGRDKSDLNVLVSELPDESTNQQPASITCAHYQKKVHRFYIQAYVIIYLPNYNKTQQKQANKNYILSVTAEFMF